MGQAFGWGASIVGGLEVEKKTSTASRPASVGGAINARALRHRAKRAFSGVQRGRWNVCLVFLPFLVLDRLAAGWVQAKDGLHIGSLEKLVVRAVRKLSSLPLSSAVWLVQPVVGSAS